MNAAGSGADECSCCQNKAPLGTGGAAVSGIVTGWVSRQHTGSPVSKLVLYKLADNANDEGYCYPSIRTIVRDTELSLRTVREHLEKLEQLGLITIIRREKQGVKLPNRYQLNLNGWPDEVTPRANGGGSAAGALPVQLAHDVVQEVHGGSAAGALGVVQLAHDNIDEPPIEPSIEPSSDARDGSLPLGEGSPQKKQKPKSEYSYGFEKVWPEFRKWPDNNGTKYAAWMAYQRTKDVRPSDDDLVVAARAEARWLAEQNRNRKPNDQQKPKHPSTWLHNRGWERWLDEATAREASNYPPIKITLAPQHVEALRNAGLSEVTVATWFADGEYHAGAFLAATQMKRNWIANHYARELAKAFGAGVTITVRQETKSNAA
jgi:DNA-binding transcriptional ArsR family regulator